MRLNKKWASLLIERLIFGLLCLNFSPVFADNPFIQLDDKVNITKGNSLSVLSNILKNGTTLLLFTTCIVMFVKFISTVNHGIEVAKKNEASSMTDFISFIIMGIIQLVLCLGAGYAGYTVITKFNLAF